MLTKVRCYEYNYDSGEWSTGIRLPVMENYASFGLIFAQQNNYNYIDPYILYSSMVGKQEIILMINLPSRPVLWRVIDTYGM